MYNLISSLRSVKGITQTELANALNVSRNSISSIETQKYDPSLKLAHKIAKYFNLQIENIFYFKEEKQ